MLHYKADSHLLIKLSHISKTQFILIKKAYLSMLNMSTIRTHCSMVDTFSILDFFIKISSILLTIVLLVGVYSPYNAALLLSINDVFKEVIASKRNYISKLPIKVFLHAGHHFMLTRRSGGSTTL